MVLDPFQILLNNISNELHEKNLQSLIHVCGDLIPGGQRERISSGWDIFSILRQQNVIGNEPERIVNLLLIIKELRPKRRDLVTLITRHVQKYYEQTEAEHILEDFESSSDSGLPFPVSSRNASRSSTPVPQDDCCRIRCCGCACNYNPCCDGCCCCVILAIVLLFLAIAATLAWYGSIPQISKHIKSDDDLHQAGPYVIGGLGFLTVCCVAGAIYIRFCKRSEPVEGIPRQASFPETSSIGASYAASDSIRSYHSGMGRGIPERPRHYSGSSGPPTASTCSLASRTSSRNPRYFDDVVPDGPQQDDYPEFFTQDMNQDDEAPIVV